MFAPVRLPFVSRLAYDTLREQVAESERRYQTLLAAFTAVQTRPEHSPPLTVTAEGKVEPLVTPPKPRDIIQETIRQESGGDRRMMEHLRKRARELRQENPLWSADQIAGELARWETADDELQTVSEA